MTTNQNGDDDSFIILGSSPGSSLDMKISGTENGDIVIDKDQMEEAMKDLPHEANMAFKAHFKLGKISPSPASMMIATTIVNDDKSTEELQKHFGEILDENVILKETLKQNNESLKEQFMMIASCQEDMMQTHMLHKEKFEETKQLVEKLRNENKKLKQDITHLSQSVSQMHSHTNSENGEKELVKSLTNSENGEKELVKSFTNSENEEKELLKSGRSSALEFVSSPDDDTINKLTAQLELVEKQRRQVIADNHRLTWQRESLEAVLDAVTKERDELMKEYEESEKIRSWQVIELGCQKEKVLHLEKHIDTLSAGNDTNAIVEERDLKINQLESKQATLLAELKASQLRIFELESVKIEVTKLKFGESEMVKMYTEQLQDLRNKLKDLSTIMFQPVRISMSEESTSLSSKPSSLTSKIKLYDKTLKHLVDVLNSVVQGTITTLFQTLRSVANLQECRLERCSLEQFKTTLAELKQQIEQQYSTTLNNVGQVRSSFTIFEGIFRDYKELLNISVAKPKVERSSTNVEALTAALVARGEELKAMEAELSKLKDQKESLDVMKAQLDLYKCDFEAERKSRQQMASEKETLMTDIRNTMKRNNDLKRHLDEVRKLNPIVYQMSASWANVSPPVPSPHYAGPTRPSPSTPTTTSNTTKMLMCPKCMTFKCEEYQRMVDHVDFCLNC